MSTKPEVLDLTDLIPEDSALFPVMLAGTNTPSGWEWTLAGPGHDKAVNWATNNSQKRLSRQARLDAQQANGRKVKPEEKSTDEQKAENVDWIISRTLGWTPSAIKLPFFDEPLGFSDDNTRKILLHPKMGWLFAQLVDFVTEEANFTKRSAKT